MNLASSCSQQVESNINESISLNDDLSHDKIFVDDSPFEPLDLDSVDQIKFYYKETLSIHVGSRLRLFWK